jgi:tripartite-type tricarboxylate transporter receptor subunit TctC
MAVAAQSYPTKPVRLIVSFAAGGPTDVVARMLGEKLGAAWGQPVVVENRAGAGGTIGSALVAKAAPDGYTLNLAASAHVYNGFLFDNLPYDPIRDFTPIAKVSYYPLLLVSHPSFPAASVKELVDYARANPGKLAFGSAGGGTGSHLTAELFRRAAGVDVLIVHYKGAAPASTDLLGGRLHAMFDNPVSALQHVKDGKLRALATTGPKRSPWIGLPTVAESGYPGFESGVWFAFIGPAGLPADIVNRVATDVGTLLDMMEVQQRLAALGLETSYSTPAQLAASMRSDSEKYGVLLRGANIKAN